MKSFGMITCGALLSALLSAESQSLPMSDNCGIDAVCYSPAYRDICCDVGVTVHADFLYWYGKESQIPYAAVFTATDVGLQSESLARKISDIKEIGVKWEPGVRVGIGFTGCSGWDSKFDWTYYKNSSNAATALPPVSNFGTGSEGEQIATSFWYNTAFFVANAVRGKWDFDINRFSLTLGNHYSITRSLSLRPFIGASGYVSETRFKVTQSLDDTILSQGIPIGTNDRFYVTKFNNSNWGGGIISGVELFLGMGCGFSLYSTLDFDLLWGRHSAKTSQNIFYQEIRDSFEGIFQELDYVNSYDDVFYAMQPILDLSIGLQWKWAFCDCRYQTLFQVGWEHHQLFDHNVRRQISNYDRYGIRDFDESENYLITYVGTYRQNSGDVMLGGLTVRVQLDF